MTDGLAVSEAIPMGSTSSASSDSLAQRGTDSRAEEAVRLQRASVHGKDSCVIHPQRFVHAIASVALTPSPGGLISNLDRLGVSILCWKSDGMPHDPAAMLGHPTLVSSWRLDSPAASAEPLTNADLPAGIGPSLPAPRRGRLFIAGGGRHCGGEMLDELATRDDDH